MTLRLLLSAALALTLPACLYDAPRARVGAAAPSLVGTAWRGWSLSQNGPWTPFPAGQPITLTFGRDGQARGEADCNRFSGPYAGGTRGRVAFGALAATRVGCAPGSMGADFLRVLGAGERYAVAGEFLTIHTPTGEMVQFRPLR